MPGCCCCCRRRPIPIASDAKNLPSESNSDLCKDLSKSSLAVDITSTTAARRTVSVKAWIQWFLGVGEKELVRDPTIRQDIFDAEKQCFLHLDTGESLPVGHFHLKSVFELECQLTDSESAPGPTPFGRIVPLTIQDDVDMGELQATLTTEDKAMVQLTSNFNCVEVPTRRVWPDNGHLVEGYPNQFTQAASASFGVPAAALFRCHYCFHAPDVSPSDWGQTTHQQLELLDDVRQHFGTCINGKLTLSGSEEELTADKIESVHLQIKVGIHEDCEVVFDRADDSNELRILPEPWQRVDQVLSSSANWHSAGVATDTHLSNVTRAALRASYRGAYLAAIRRQRRRLYLTVVGGEIFGNPLEMILGELAEAHKQLAAHPSSCLQEVVLCLPGKSETALQHMLAGFMAKV